MGILDQFESDEFYPGSRHKIGAQREAAKRAARWDDNPKTFKVGGVDTEFFTIGQLAMALRRKPVTLRKWERDGFLPKPTFRKPSQDPRGQRRLYSRKQVEGLMRIAEEEGILLSHNKPITKTQFTARAVALFRELSK